jgi:hypothetical protein
MQQNKETQFRSRLLRVDMHLFTESRQRHTDTRRLSSDRLFACVAAIKSR